MRLHQLLIAIVFLSGSVGIGNAQTADSCLVVNNATDNWLSIEVSGYQGTFWDLQPNNTFALRTPQGALVSGATFTLQVYRGNQGSRGQYVGQTAPNAHDDFAIWTYIKPNDQFFTERRMTDCAPRGAWLALLNPR